VLTALPNPVVTEIRPDPVKVGTALEREVEVAAEALAGVILKRTLFALGVVWKLVPVIVTGVPAVPIVGVKPVIVGAAELLIVNTLALVAEPPGVDTPIEPVLAPAGTVAIIWVAVDDTTAAVVPLNATVF